MSEVSYWELVAAVIGVLLGLGLADRLGRKSKWSVGPNTFLVYGFMVVVAGIILPFIAILVLGGPWWTLVALIPTALLYKAVYGFEHLRRDRRIERTIRFVHSQRENDDDTDDPFGFFHL